MSDMGALKGIKVLDLSRMLPGPYCSMILADHGAEVIAVESRRFQGDGLFFNDLNRNKRHMSLDLKNSKGLEIFFKLAEKTDIIIEGFRPGVVKRLGVDYESVKKINPSIIYCSITGYGQSGPLANRVGHDINYLAQAGILDLIGPADGAPTVPAVQLADIAGGSLQSVIGILMALYAREKHPERIGQYIDIAMTDGMIGFHALPYFLVKQTGKAQKRSNTMLSHRYGCYNTYETADGRYVAIGAVENRFWKKLCEVLGKPEYGKAQYDENVREEIIAWLRETFLKKPLSKWDNLLSDLEVCYAPVQTMEEVFEDEHFLERSLVIRNECVDGSEQVSLGLAVKLGGSPGSLRTGPQDFGQGTSEILQEIGYGAEEIEEIYRLGAV
ncbi:CaiB/BaiF CoA transferase family protein [Desulfomarina sp.]